MNLFLSAWRKKNDMVIVSIAALHVSRMALQDGNAIMMEAKAKVAAKA